MNQPIEEKWKEEFNNRFDIGPIFLKSGGVRISALYGPEEIISFIENLLEQERQRMSEEIEKLKQYNSHIGIGGLHSADMQIVHNDAIDKALSIINK
jgi:hypothetical protein